MEGLTCGFNKPISSLCPNVPTIFSIYAALPKTHQELPQLLFT